MKAETKKTSTKATKASKGSKAAEQVVAPAATDDGLAIPASLVRKPTAQKGNATTTAPKAEATQKAEPKKAKQPVKVAKVKKATPLSMSRALKDLVVREPKITTDELYAKLEAKGFKGRSKTTVSTLQSDAITTLRAAADAGLFPKWD